MMKNQFLQNGDLAGLDFVVNRTANSVILRFYSSLESSCGYIVASWVAYPTGISGISSFPLAYLVSTGINQDGGSPICSRRTLYLVRIMINIDCMGKDLDGPEGVQAGHSRWKGQLAAQHGTERKAHKGVKVSTAVTTNTAVMSCTAVTERTSRSSTRSPALGAGPADTSR